MNSKKHIQKTFQGSAAKLRFALVVSRFNYHITAKLLEGAEHCLRDHGVPEKNRKVIFCPGAFELPQVANWLAAQKKWDAIICLGVVIRGDTPHFEYISAETTRGIQNVALHYSLPVVFGVLTTDNEQQALDRVGGAQGHKGWDAALTALEMVTLFKTLKRKSR
ncbi:MAG: 6,7-dimethyl-8-ribityllumazine synthase [Bacteroidota bacterium]|jgi:6,7-dimethyl-8-ribityllumazine synthase